MPTWLTILIACVGLLLGYVSWSGSGGASAGPRPPSWFLADYGKQGFQATSTELCERMGDYAIAYISENPKIEEALGQLAPTVGIMEAHRKLHEQLTPGMRRLSLMSVFDYNIENGGAFQFFFNAGEAADEVSTALGELGALRLKKDFDALVHEVSKNASDIERARRATVSDPPDQDGVPSKVAHAAHEAARIKLEHLTVKFDEAYVATPAIGANSGSDSIRGEMCRAMVTYIESHRAEFEVSYQ